MSRDPYAAQGHPSTATYDNGGGNTYNDSPFANRQHHAPSLSDVDLDSSSSDTRRAASAAPPIQRYTSHISNYLAQNIAAHDAAPKPDGSALDAHYNFDGSNGNTTDHVATSSSALATMRFTADEAALLSASDINAALAGVLSTIDPSNDRIYSHNVTKHIFFRYWDALGGYALAYATMGMSLSMVGPTMLVLGRQVGTTSTSSLSLTYLGRAIGFFLGSLAGGQLVDRLGPRRAQIALSATVIISALTTLLYPAAGSLFALVLVAGLCSFWMGCLDNLAQVLLMRVCGRYGEPMMQALHAGFAVGSFFAPIVISFFLTEVEPDGEPLVSTLYRWGFYSMTITMIAISFITIYLTIRGRGPFGPHRYCIQTSERAVAAALIGIPEHIVPVYDPTVADCTSITPPEDDAKSDAAEYAAADAAAAGGGGSGAASSGDSSVTLPPLVATDADTTQRLSAAPSTAVVSANNGEAVIVSDSELPTQVGGDPNCCRRLNFCARLNVSWVVPHAGFSGNPFLVLCLMATLLFFYVGSETGFGHFIAPYANKRGFMDDHEASLLSSVFWGLFAIGRISGIPLSVYIVPETLVTINVAAAAAVMVVMSIFSDSVPLLWVCVALLGFCMASLYAACVMWLERYIKLSGTVLSVIVVAVSLAEALVPMIVGASFDLPAGPVSMMYLITGLLCACGGMLFFFRVYVARNFTRGVITHGTVHVAAIHSEAAGGNVSSSGTYTIEMTSSAVRARHGPGHGGAVAAGGNGQYAQFGDEAEDVAVSSSGSALP